MPPKKGKKVTSADLDSDDVSSVQNGVDENAKVKKTRGKVKNDDRKKHDTDDEDEGSVPPAKPAKATKGAKKPKGKGKKGDDWSDDEIKESKVQKKVENKVGTDDEEEAPVPPPKPVKAAKKGKPKGKKGDDWSDEEPELDMLAETVKDVPKPKKKPKGKSKKNDEWSDDEPKVDMLKGNTSGEDDEPEIPKVPSKTAKQATKPVKKAAVKIEVNEDDNSESEPEEPVPVIKNKLLKKASKEPDPFSPRVTRARAKAKAAPDNGLDSKSVTEDDTDDVSEEKPVKSKPKKVSKEEPNLHVNVTRRKKTPVDELTDELEDLKVEEEPTKNTDEPAVGDATFVVDPEPKKLTHKEKKKLKKQQEFEKQLEVTTKKGGQGHSALGDNFTVSQMQKTTAQLALMENAVDIKVSSKFKCSKLGFEVLNVSFTNISN